MLPFPIQLLLQWDVFLFVLEIIIFALLLACFLRLFRSPLSKREKHQILEFIWNLTPGKRRDYPYSDIFHSSIRTSKNELFGIELDEPFKKLEGDTEERRYWLQKQQRCFQDYVDEHLKTNRSYFKSRMRKYQKGESFETPFQLNDNIYFYFKKTRRDSRHYILYCTPNVRQKGVPLLNPNVEFGNKSASIAILGTWISEDCRKLAYAFADLTPRSGGGSGGSVTLKIRDVESRKDTLVDTLVFPGAVATVSAPVGSDGDGSSSSGSSHMSIASPCTLSVSWIHRKHKGFFYTRWVIVSTSNSNSSSSQEAATSSSTSRGRDSGDPSRSSSSSSVARTSSVVQCQEVCFHRLNTPQHADLVVHRGARSTHTHVLTVSQDDRSVSRR